jgi:diacylglycerol kinase
MKWVSKGKKKTYSIKRLGNSFKYALQGIKSAYKTEQNLLVHTVVAILVIALGVIIQLSFLEFAVVFLVIGVVMTAEMINTSIEYAIDMAMPSIHPLAKVSKDVASGAVLFSAIIAIIVGCLIYIPKLIKFIELMTN